MMSSLFPRKGTRKLYAKIRDVDGVWQQIATGFSVDQRADAERYIEGLERDIAAEVDKRRRITGPLTVAKYAAKWLDARTTKTVKDDRTRIEKHALPVIGHLPLVDVRPRHLRDLVMGLRRDGKLAPKTIRQITGVLHSLFKSAEIDELITSNPVKFERGVLPKKVDRDPTWRHEAIFSRAEVEQLISDDRIPVDRRVLYALKFFTGRHTECATLTWSQYDASSKPLGAINLGETKNGVPRRVPVHPTLAKVLATWKLAGWEDLYGHRPQPVDMIVPTRNLNKRRADEAQKQLLLDLDRLGLRREAGRQVGRRSNRRGHDLRRTLITLARSDGAIDSILRHVTHGPSQNEMLDVYSSPPWEDLCREVAKLRVELIEGRLVQFGAVA